MRIEKWYIDFLNDQYYVYTKKQIDKNTKVENPLNASYFNTLSGALTEVRYLMIGAKIGKNKDDDLAKVITYITDVDKYFIKCLDNLTKEQGRLADNLIKEQAVGQEEQS